MRFHTLAIDFLPPPVVFNRMRWLAGVLAGGAAQPLPTTSFGLGATTQALRCLAQSKHTGWWEVPVAVCLD